MSSYLIQYSYASMNAMYEYLQGRYRRSQLLDKLQEMENHHKNETGEDKTLWFSFSDGLTLSITDISNILKFEHSQTYHNLMECFSKAAFEDGLKVYSK